MPLKRKTIKEKACRECGQIFPIEKLSNNCLCYDCAKARMLKAFDILWQFGR